MARGSVNVELGDVRAKVYLQVLLAQRQILSEMLEAVVYER